MGTVENTEQKAVLPLHFRIGTFTTSCTTNHLQKPDGEIYIDEAVFARADLNDDNDFGDTGEEFYYLHNTQYSVHAILDTSGSIIEVYKNYQPYGAVEVYTGDGGDGDWWDGDETTGSLSGNYYLFTGRRHDPEADLMFYRNRMYSTSRGRFLQRDPIGYRAGMNLYCAYFVPSGVDPFGELEGEHLQAYEQMQQEEDESYWEYIEERDRRRAEGSGTADSFWNVLMDKINTGQVSWSGSQTIGGITAGPVFTVGFGFSGAIKNCIKKDGSRGRMWEGAVTVSAAGGLGVGSGSSGLPGGSSGGAPTTGSGLGVTVGGGGKKCTPCTNTLGVLNYNLNLVLEAGGGGVGASLTQQIAECSADLDCEWSFTSPPSWNVSLSASLTPFANILLAVSATTSGTKTIE